MPLMRTTREKRHEQLFSALVGASAVDARGVFGWQASYSFTPDLIVSTFVQYDSSMGHTGVNARLRWTLAPGRDFFLVLNHGVEAPITGPNARAPCLQHLIAKLRWDFYR